MNVSDDLMCRIHNLLCDITESRHDDRRYYAPRLDADRVDEIAAEVAEYLADNWEFPTPSGEALTLGICRTCDTDIEHDGFKWNHALKMLDAEHTPRPKGAASRSEVE